MRDRKKRVLAAFLAAIITISMSGISTLSASATGDITADSPTSSSSEAGADSSSSSSEAGADSSSSSSEAGADSSSSSSEAGADNSSSSSEAGADNSSSSSEAGADSSSSSEAGTDSSSSSSEAGTDSSSSSSEAGTDSSGSGSEGESGSGGDAGQEEATCTCGALPNEEGVTTHTEGCPLYKAPAPEGTECVCAEKCGQVPNQECPVCKDDAAKCAIKGQIISVAALEEAQAKLTVTPGTAKESIDFPATMKATVKAGADAEAVESDVAVKWDCATYDANVENSYVFTATAEGYTLAEGVSLPEISVTVAEMVTIFVEESSPTRPVGGAEDVDALGGLLRDFSGTWSGSGFKDQLGTEAKGFYTKIYNALSSGLGDTEHPFTEANRKITLSDAEKTFTNVTLVPQSAGGGKWKVSQSNGTYYPDYTVQSVEYDTTKADWDEAVQSALDALTYDHPEIFWLKLGQDGSASSFGSSMSASGVPEMNADGTPKDGFTVETITGATVTLELSLHAVSNNFGSLNELNTKIAAAKTAIQQKITNNSVAYPSTPYGKLKAVHDYVCETLTYDKNGINEPVNQTVWSAFNNRTTVCAGYAKMFKLLSDYPCVLVAGYGETDSKSEAHMWNYVQIGSNWYAVDTTWDDRDGNTLYDFFLTGGNEKDEHFGEKTFLTSHIPSGKLSGLDSISFGYPTLSPTKFDSSVSGTVATVSMNNGQAEECANWDAVLTEIGKASASDSVIVTLLEDVQVTTWPSRAITLKVTKGKTLSASSAPDAAVTLEVINSDESVANLDNGIKILAGTDKTTNLSMSGANLVGSKNAVYVAPTSYTVMVELAAEDTKFYNSWADASIKEDSMVFLKDGTSTGTCPKVNFTVKSANDTAKSLKLSGGGQAGKTVKLNNIELILSGSVDSALSFTGGSKLSVTGGGTYKLGGIAGTSIPLTIDHTSQPVADTVISAPGMAAGTFAYMEESGYESKVEGNTFTVKKLQNSTLALELSKASASYGEEITLTATVSSQMLRAVDGKNRVTFKYKKDGASGATPADAMAIGDPQDVTGGKASVKLKTSAMAGVGSYVIYADYDGQFGATAASDSKAFTVTQGTPEITIEADKTQELKSREITLTVQVKYPGKADNDTFPATVTITPSVTGTLGTVSEPSVNGDTATYTAKYQYSAGDTGDKDVTFSATVGAKDNYTTSTTSKFATVKFVDKYKPTITLKASSNDLVEGDELTLTATVTKPDAAAAENPPTGDVKFSDGPSGNHTVPLSNGTAVYKLPSMAVGKYTYTAQYTPDVNDEVYQASESVSAEVIVRPAAPAASVVKVDYETEKITIDSNTPAYEVNTAADFSGTPVTDSITALLDDSVKEIYVRVAEDAAAGIPASAATKIPLLARPAATTFTIDFPAETTKELIPATVEYTIDNGAAWKAGETKVLSLTPGAAEKNILFREKAAAGKPHGATQTLTIPKRPDKPASIAGTATDTTVVLTPLTGVEYREETAGTWQDSNTFKNLQPNTAYTFEARVKATASNFASEITKSAPITTKRATLKVVSAPTAQAEFGTQVNAIPLTGGSVSYGETPVAGTWAWENTGDTTLPEVNGTATFAAVFTPDTNGQYEKLTVKIKPEITPKALTIATVTIPGKIYDGTDSVSGASVIFNGEVPGQTVAYTVQAQYASPEAGIAKAVTGTVTLTGAQAKNYTLSDGAIPANTTGDIRPAGGSASNPSVFQVFGKEGAEYTYDLNQIKFKNVVAPMTAEPITYEVTAVTDGDNILETAPAAGQVSDGKLTFKTKDGLTEGQSAKIAITLHSANYTDAQVTLTISAVDMPVPVPKGEVTVTGTLTYGQKISALTLNNPGFAYNGTDVPGQLAWADGTTIPPAGTQTFGWTFTPNDPTAYATVYGNVTVTVLQATDPGYQVPVLGDIPYDPMKTLNNVTLPAGWTWEDATIVPTCAVSVYYADYTPLDTGYRSEKHVAITLNVLQAEPTVAAPTIDNVVRNFVTTLSGVQLPEDPNGVWSWKNPNQALKDGTDSYKALYKPNDANYKQVERAVSITTSTVTATIKDDSGTTIAEAKIELSGTNASKKFKYVVSGNGSDVYGWKIQDETIATVASDGTVTAKKAGTTILSVMMYDGGQSVSIGSITIAVAAAGEEAPGLITNTTPPETVEAIVDSLGVDDTAVIKKVAEDVTKNLSDQKKKNLSEETINTLDSMAASAFSASTNIEVTKSGTDEPENHILQPGDVIASGLVLAAYEKVKNNSGGPITVTLKVEQKKTNAAKEELLSLEITLKAGNDNVSELAFPAKITMAIPEGLDLTNAKLFHNNTEIRYEVSGNSLWFWADSFSPYVFKKVSTPTPVPPTPTPDGGNKPSGGSGGSGGGSSSGGSSSGASIFGFRNGELNFWNSVTATVKKAKAGDLVKINAKGYDRVPSSLLNALFGKDVTLQISWKGGSDIVINGKSPIRPEDKRIYYPLSMLAELYADGETLDAALPEGAEDTVPETLTGGTVPSNAGGSYTGSKGTPATGGVWNLEAPATGDFDAQPTAIDQGVGTPEQLRALENSPTLLDQGEEALQGLTLDAAEKAPAGKIVIGIMAAIIVLAGAAALMILRKRRDNM